MKINVPIIATALLLLAATTGRCESGMSYNETVDFIKSTLPGISSDVRKENYDYIKFNGCLLDYGVSGLYPIGTPYTNRYSNIDFSSLNSLGSKTGADYSDFIILDFDKPFTSRTGRNELVSRTVVVDAASHDQAEKLFRAFLRLGELCRAGKQPTTSTN